jgi:hypothetical protein
MRSYSTKLSAGKEKNYNGLHPMKGSSYLETEGIKLTFYSKVMNKENLHYRNANVYWHV